MLKFLRISYPFSHNLRQNARTIFIISLSIIFILFIFQPLDINSLDWKDKSLLIVGLGIASFLSLSFNLLILPSFLSKMFLTNWVIWKEVLWNSWILLTLSASFYMTYTLLDYSNIDLNLIIRLVLLSIIPLALLIVFNRNRLLRIRLRIANELTDKLNEGKDIAERLIHFDSDYQKDKFSVKAGLLVMIKAADNYVEIFWREGDVVKSQYIRSTLSRVQNFLEEYSNMYRCHRSYIVNLDYINKVEGNSQGYQLLIEGLSFKIPVSRNIISQLKQKTQLI